MVMTWTKNCYEWIMEPSGSRWLAKPVSSNVAYRNVILDVVRAQKLYEEN